MHCPRLFVFSLPWLASSALAQSEGSGELAAPESPPEEATQPPALLTQDSAVSFLQDCLKKVLARDESLWIQTADGGLFPEGYWPFALKHLGEPGASLWTMGFQELDGWLSPENIDALPEKVQVVETLHTLELRDLRPFPLEDFLDESKRPDPMPTVAVNTLSLGIDFDADGSISRDETAYIHELEGIFYWDPFGW